MKKMIGKIIACVLLMATLLSIVIIPASAAPEYPDGGTYTTYDHLGSVKWTSGQLMLVNIAKIWAVCSLMNRMDFEEMRWSL